MQIELLHVSGCPNLERAREGIRLALQAAGVSASVRELEIDTAEAASAAGMRGSPTILIDGSDPFSAGAGDASLSCRLYRTAEGVDGVPTVAQLVEVLSHARPA